MMTYSKVSRITDKCLSKTQTQGTGETPCNTVNNKEPSKTAGHKRKNNMITTQHKCHKKKKV